MFQEESIYNLIPKEIIEPVKEPTYRSQYPHWIAPTASTFGLKTSSFPNVANMNGDISYPRGAHPLKSAWATLGKPSGSYRADPENFVKKGHQYKTLPQAEKMRSTSEIKKPQVPTLQDKPIMGLKSDKNFITANAVDVILMVPKKKTVEKTSYLNKKDYGKVPEYMNTVKNRIENEYKTIREMQIRTDEEEAKKKKVLVEDEVNTLREGLTKKLQMLKMKYGEITHKKSYDTLVMLRKYILFKNFILEKKILKKKWRLLKKI
jgi:hypothetical protein